MYASSPGPDEGEDLKKAIIQDAFDLKNVSQIIDDKLKAIGEVSLDKFSSAVSSFLDTDEFDAQVGTENALTSSMTAPTAAAASGGIITRHETSSRTRFNW